jgi:hypothetical protein
MWTVSTQEEFERVRPAIRPAKNWNMTTGVTQWLDGVTLTYDAYYSAIRDRLLSAAVGSQYAQVNTVSVMPRTHVVGADVGTTFDLSRHVQFYQGIATARSFYDRDFVASNQVFPIKGKAQPGYPIVSLVSDLSARLRAWRLWLGVARLDRV